jgi:hypothetical protein
VARRAWVLNLDAELELDAIAPSAALRARLDAIAEHTIAKTLEPGDRVLVPQLHDRGDPHSLRGFAWCPTPRALASLARLGIAPADAPPSFEVLHRANERGLAHSLSAGELELALRATSVEDVLAHVERSGPTGQWLLKRGLGVSGRGQRALAAGRVAPPDRAWIAASLRRGALYVEPRLAIVRELSVHAWAAHDRVEVRSIRAPRVGPDRAFVSSSLALDLAPSLERALVDSAERAGRALIAVGYRGPFGIDAFEHRTASGAIALRSLSEINARYCMGWDRRDGWEPPP